MMVKDDGTRINGLTISSINDDIIELTGHTFIIGETGYLTYDTYSACVIRQQLFFFLNNSVW